MKRRRKRKGRKKGRRKKDEIKKMLHRESNLGPFAWKVETLTVDRPMQALDCMHVLYRHTSQISIVMN